MNKLNERINGLSEGQFTALQAILAIVLAILGSVCILFLDNNEGEALNTVGLAGALILCGGLPMLMARGIERPMRRLNLFLLVALVVILLGYVLIRFAV